jgi:hypothetical protein
MSALTQDSQPHDADAKRLALEAIATLAYVKKIAADQILRPAGVPDALIKQFVKGRDPATGDALTKRQGGAMILDELAKTGGDREVIRKIVESAASWTGFHLANNEYEARAVVQKARELSGVLAEADQREKERKDRADAERAARQKSERDSALRKESALLLQQFDEAMAGEERQQRGYFLQDLLNRAFDLHGIPSGRAFQRKAGGEQIDGAFALDGWHYVVECRWREALADIRQLDGLYGQMARSGRQTMELFLSINGWSSHVVPLAKQNPSKSIILMEGFDLRTVLAHPFDLKHLLRAKLRALNLDAEPYFSISQLLSK